jgi:hypothetical protein
MPSLPAQKRGLWREPRLGTGVPHETQETVLNSPGMRGPALSKPLSTMSSAPRSAGTGRFLRVLTVALSLVGGWAGCRCRPAPPAAEAPAKPSLRLLLFSGVAGALEPCGCVKDMLGGVDHAASYLRAQGGMPTLALGAGPMLFLDPTLAPERRVQDEWKAESLSRALREMNLRAWAPAVNDFAAGTAALSRWSDGGPSLLAANLQASGVGFRRSAEYSVGGLRVGVTAVSQPKALARVEGLEAREPLPELRAAAQELEKQGVALRVALLAMPRGEALRLVELVPEFHVAVVGKSIDQGESNDPPTPPTLIGKTLVVEAQNHLQSFYVVDLFVKNGSFEFKNGDENAERRSELKARIAELEGRIREAEGQKGVRAEDLAARRKDLAARRAELADAEKGRSQPEGSYYRAERVEVREGLGSDPRVHAELGQYYKRVNEHNRVAFADRKPAPAPEGTASYVGVETCANCHAEEHAFWLKTRHANAYRTLSSQFKEFNLDCVGCHVTGYEKPGGSTVTHVSDFTNVQCEVCHGPGSRHVADNKDPLAIIAKPDRAQCGPKCHHLPHVKADWSADKAFEQIVGPGHGR